MNAKKQKRLRDRLRHLLRDLEALLVAGNLMTIAARSQLKARKVELSKRPSIKKIELDIRLAEIEIAKLRDWLGVKVPNHKLVELLQFVEEAPQGKTALVPKHILQDLFAFPEHSFERFGDFPAHTRILVYLTKPSHHAPHKTVDWRSTEATLFEDMCALFNLAWENSHKIGTAIDSLKARKMFNAQLRATASAAFYFVEAYLNGLAYDHYIAFKRTLDEDSIKKLTEWNSSSSKPSYLSLRDKLVQYPRIILGVTHPPLQENNCPELDFICGKAKLLRDSIVHASPSPDRRTLEAVKELALFNINLDEVEKVVDNAILLVRKIESTIRGNEKYLFWIRERRENGLFPNEVFR